METLIQKLRKITLIVTLLLVCLSIGCQKTREEVLTKDQARTLIAGYLKFRNDGDLAAADEVLHPDCVIRYSNMPEDIVGLEAFIEYDKTTRIGFPDLKLTIDDFFVKDDKIVSYWTFTATHTGILKGPMGDLPPTNKKVQFKGFAISRVKDGKIIEDVAYFDVLSMMQQLGFTLVPPEPQSTGKL